MVYIKCYSYFPIGRLNKNENYMQDRNFDNKNSSYPRKIFDRNDIHEWLIEIQVPPLRTKSRISEAKNALQFHAYGVSTE
jgi:hypothetical protein